MLANLLSICLLLAGVTTDSVAVVGASEVSIGTIQEEQGKQESSFWIRNVGDDAVILGSPAMPADRQKKIFVMQRKLEEMYNDIQELKKTINER
jgi:hypothetical protein